MVAAVRPDLLPAPRPASEHPALKETANVRSQGAGSGRANTCRRSIRGTGASRRSVPQPAHSPCVRCGISGSGTFARSRVAPGCPFSRPGPRPERPRGDFGPGSAGSSDDGGLEEFREFCPSRASRSVIRVHAAASSARSSTTSAASSSYEGERSSTGADPRQHQTEQRDQTEHRAAPIQSRVSCPEGGESDREVPEAVFVGGAGCAPVSDAGLDGGPCTAPPTPRSAHGQKATSSAGR